MNNLSEILEIKKCNHCKIEKPICEFYKGAKRCIVCSKQDYQDNKAKIMARQREYYKNNLEKVRASKIKYNHKNKEKLNAWHKIDRKKNKERAKKTAIQWIEKNRGKRAKSIKEWSIKNRDRINQRRRNRRKNDLIYRNILALRNGVARALKYKAKPKGTLKLLGCSPEFFIKYIENKFQDGMNWDNWSNGEGKWNLDHILPINSFNFSKSEFWKICFHYTNLQPLWWRDNAEKYTKLGWQPKNKKE